jgi:asparagine synthase (glutamine-hydrolysing)
MSVALESRIPILDPCIVEFAWKLPLAFKANQHTGKLILRKVLAKYVPKSFFERPKMGFGVPMANWLRGALRNWAESLLSVSRLSHEGYFDTASVRAIWADHLSGRNNHAPTVWAILMFQSWLESKGRIRRPSFKTLAPLVR